MKPIREWLEQLPEGYRERAIAALLPDRSGRKVRSMDDAILDFCEWSATPEGSPFWSSLHDFYLGERKLKPKLPPKGPPAKSLERETLEALKKLVGICESLGGFGVYLTEPKDILTRAKQQNKIS